ncbi:hypothetical protein [Garicola koreensis]|uniref:Uncharacterized protein n=1 Tax=Garicola koreensis TaxID=1262554 RepID=A0A7W5TUU0_9MICC|nr:hypothetical protein [Garicola koreensis]MBB3667468.1 hypothetical protein [Garicola koreensis]MBB3667679.1 hypothetical protein [Garicola koreensis]
MSEPSNALTAAYSRAHKRDWMAEKRESHRRWRRRRLLQGSGLAAAVGVVAFIVYDYPRESGLTDALGLTCGEYVHVGDPSGVQPPFADWDVHQQALSGDDDVDEQQLISAVEIVAQEFDAQPVLGQFDPGGITQRQHSAAAVGDQLLIGHHEEYWTGTDRVSLFDPQTASITWTAQTIHPVRDHSVADSRQRVLYGVGTAGSHVVLQTPTYHGDTDLVTAALGSDDDPECLRLDGGVETQQITGEHQGHATAWSQVLNLNAGRLGENEFQIHHGLDEDTPEHQLSAVDVVTERVEPAEPPLDVDAPADSVEIPAVAQEQFDAGFESLQTVGENHYLLTWEAGSVILERH